MAARLSKSKQPGLRWLENISVAVFSMQPKEWLTIFFMKIPTMFRR